MTYMQPKLLKNTKIQNQETNHKKTINQLNFHPHMQSKWFAEQDID